MPRFIIILAWAWMIVIGGLLVTPGGITCIRCGPTGQLLIGIISIVLGLAGIVGAVRARA